MSDRLDDDQSKADATAAPEGADQSIPVIKVDTSPRKVGKGSAPNTRSGKKGRRDSGTFDASVLAAADQAQPPQPEGTVDETAGVATIQTEEAAATPDRPEEEASPQTSLPQIDTAKESSQSRKTSGKKRKPVDKSSKRATPVIQIAEPGSEDTEPSVVTKVGDEDSAEPAIKIEEPGETQRKPARVKTRADKSRSGKARPAGPQKKKAVPPAWIAIGACGGSALVVIVLLISLLSGPDKGAGGSGQRSRTPAAPAARDLSLPTFESDIPTGGSGTGVRAMDSEEIRRRREGMDSFAAMGREEEAKLRGEKKPAAKKKAN
jgi:hypothetical protein